jgi:hypothetical protein
MSGAECEEGCWAEGEGDKPNAPPGRRTTARAVAPWRNNAPTRRGGGVRQKRKAPRDCHGPMALPHSTAYKLATEHHESE